MSVSRKVRRVAAVVPVVAVLLAGTPFVGSASAALATTSVSPVTTSGKRPVVSASFNQPLDERVSQLTLRGNATSTFEAGTTSYSADKKTIFLTLNADLTSTKNPYTARVVGVPAVATEVPPVDHSWTFTVDDAAPVLTVGAVATPTTGPVTISGTTEPNTQVALEITPDGAASPKVSSGTTSTGTGAYSFTAVDIATLPETLLRAKVTATDAVGNATQNTTVTFTRDVTAPVRNATVPGDGKTAKSTNVVAITFNEALKTSDSKMVVKNVVGSELAGVVDFPTANATDPKTVMRFTADAPGMNEAGGLYTVEATAVDLAGNSRTTTSTFSIDDTAPAKPTVSLTDPIAKANVTKAVVSGTTEKNAKIDVAVDDAVAGGAVEKTGIADADGKYSVEVDVSSLPDGKVTASARATDEAGNVGQWATSLESTLDKTPPSAPVNVDITSPIPANRIALVSGSVVAGEGATSVEISVDDDNVASTPPVKKTLALDGTTFSTNLTLTGLKDGVVTARVFAYDALKNESLTAGTDIAQLDTGLPEVATLAMPVVNDANKGGVAVTGTTTEPNMSVTVTVSDGTVTQTDTVPSNGSGAFSKTFDTTNPALADGVLTVTAQAKDGAGNESAKKSIQVVRDTQAPSDPTIVLPQWVGAATVGAVEMSGTGEAGSTLTITLTGVNNKQETHSTVVPPNGSWTKTVSFTGFDQGAVAASVRAKDTAGNDSASTGTASTTKDTIAPAAPTVDLPDDVNPGNVDSSSVTGQAENGSEVSVSVNDSDPNTAAVTGSGPASATTGAYAIPVQLSSLSDGALSASAIAKDAAGNTSAPGTMQNAATKDTTALARTATSPADGATVYTPAEVSATFNEPLHSTTTITLRDKTSSTLAGTKRIAGNTVYFTPNSLSDAASPYTVSYTAKDADASDTATGSFTFTVDTKAPAMPTVELPAVNAANDDAVTVGGKAEPGSSVEVTVTDKNGAFQKQTAPADAATGDYSVSLNLSSLADGPLTASAVAKDVAGNASPPGTDGAVKDALPPGQPQLSLPAYVNDANKGAVPATGTTDPAASVSITVVDALGGEVTTTVAADEDGTFATTLALAGLADGVLTATAGATDAAGNPSETKSTTTTKDVGVPLAPTADLADPVNAANVTTATVSGVAEPGSHVLISVDDTTPGSPVEDSTTADATTGAYSKTVDVTALADTLITATVRARDTAGNVSPGTTDTATKDATVPAKPTVSFSGPANAASTLVTFTGDAEAGSSVTISVDDDSDVTAPVSTTITAPDSGTYSEQLDLAGLADGALTARVTATDAVGNTSEAGTAQGLKDVVAPAPATITVTDPVNAAGQSAVSVSGAAEKGAQVAVTLDDQAAGDALALSTTADSSTSQWALTFNASSLTDGQLTAVATVTDAAGNASAPASDTATKDATAPGTPSVNLADPINAAGQTKVSVTGAAEPGSAIAISVDDTTAGDAKTAVTTADVTTGAYSAEFDVTELADGTLTASVTATDWAGNVSGTGTDTSEKDSSLPDVPTLTTPQAVTRASRAAAPFSGTAEPASTVGVTVDDADATTAAVSGTTVTAPDGTWSLGLDLTSLRDGTLSIAVTATDAVLNTSGTTSGSVAKNSTRAFTITVDAAPRSGADQTVTVRARSTYAIDSPVDTTYTGTPVLSSADDHTTAGTCTPAVDGVATCSGTNFGDLGSQTLRATEGSGEDLLDGASTVVVQPVALVFTVAPPATASPNQAISFTVAPTAGVPGASIAGYAARRTLVTTGGSNPNTGTVLTCAEAACQGTVTFVSRGTKTVTVVDDGTPSLSTPTVTVNIPFATALSLFRSATTVNAGSPVVLAGDLINTSTLEGVPGQRIELWRRVAPATTYSPVTSFRTDEDGIWAVMLTVSKNTTYQVRYKGAPQYLPSVSPARMVKAALIVSSTWSKSSRTVKVTGRVSPNAAGRPVYLQYRKSDGSWVYAGVQTKVSSTGTYTLSRTLSPGKWTLRAAASGTSIYASGYSKSFTTTIS